MWGAAGISRNYWSHRLTPEGGVEPVRVIATRPIWRSLGSFGDRNTRLIEGVVREVL